MSAASMLRLKSGYGGATCKQYDLRVSAHWVDAGSGAGSAALDISVRLRRGWFGRVLTHTFQVRAPGETTRVALDPETRDAW